MIKIIPGNPHKTITSAREFVIINSLQIIIEIITKLYPTQVIWKFMWIISPRLLRRYPDILKSGFNWDSVTDAVYTGDIKNCLIIIYLVSSADQPAGTVASFSNFLQDFPCKWDWNISQRPINSQKNVNSAIPAKIVDPSESNTS